MLDAGKDTEKMLREVMCFVIILLTILTIVINHDYRKLSDQLKNLGQEELLFFFFAGHVTQILAKNNQYYTFS